MYDPIQHAKQAAAAAAQRFLKTFAAVPDDKLSWSPAPTAKSALQIAAHAAAVNRGLAALIAGKPYPASPQEAPTTRAAAVKALEESAAEVQAALEGVRPDEVDTVIEAPWMKAPRVVFMNLVATHLQSHAAQIDYLQTIWGDTQFHM
ncbi:MAG: DinB family protein [Armatimonadota bacterium]|nr:DinB family protein [Armatimonadota bacterium]